MTDTTPTTELIILKTDKLGRIQTTARDRETWLDAFEQSGMSGAAFAVNPDFRTTGLSGICVLKTVKRMHENEQKTKDVYG